MKYEILRQIRNEKSQQLLQISVEKETLEKEVLVLTELLLQMDQEDATG